MCAPDTPPLWRASPLAPLIDVLLFSSEVGLRKPEPGIYLHATDRLGVRPERSLFVGDGAYGELNGAAAVGMTAVLVRDADEEPGVMLRPEAEDWEGPRISRISEVRAIIEPAGERRP
jgi:putative hydrolase of the HAD superfamily